MHKYTAKITWTRPHGEPFNDNRYTRSHTWRFDGGVTIPASASPQIVPLPYSVEENVDPEEAYVAAISSCHMLTFLGIAAKKRFVVDSYEDDAEGTMEMDADGTMSVTRVVLRPLVTYSGEKVPTKDQLEKMHHLAHEQCFIANSVKTEIVTELFR